MGLDVKAACDPRVPVLRTAVAELRRALAEYQAHLPDRGTAEEQLAELDVMAAGVPDPVRLRHSLLLVLAALGSLSALASPLAELRLAIARFGDPPAR